MAQEADRSMFSARGFGLSVCRTKLAYKDSRQLDNWLEIYQSLARYVSRPGCLVIGSVLNKLQG